MTLDDAPYHCDLACGPDGASAHWVTTSDGVRLRIGLFPAACDLAAKGTILLFPGRTEYIEKYGPTARDFCALGYSVAAIDWRGQGLAERLVPNRAVGHVHKFPDYQLDVQALVGAVRKAGLPEPLYLMAHSMGGCIGLRSLMEDLPVKAALFSAPMWGIALDGFRRTAAWTITTICRRLGMEASLAPGTFEQTYVLNNPFEDNMLTTDPDMYMFMQRQMEGCPDLALGGPSMLWLNEGLKECRALRQHASPDVPVLTVLGSNERIVETDAVTDRMARWTHGTLRMVKGAEHEVLMESPQIRADITAEADAFLQQHAA